MTLTPDIKVELFKQVLGTLLGTVMGNWCLTQAPPNQQTPLTPPKPTIGDHCLEIIKKNPGWVVNPFVNTTGAIYNKIFHREVSEKIIDAEVGESHPVNVEPGTELEAPPTKRNKWHGNRGDLIVSVFAHTIMYTIGVIALIRVINTKNLATPNVEIEMVPAEVLSDGKILEKASTVISKQIMMYLPTVAFVCSITVVIYITFDKYQKQQIKKEELILRNLQRINSKLNLLPENKEDK